MKAMISSTVEHGANMEIDLSAGLATLKTTALEPPSPEGLALPKDAFAEILEAKAPASPTDDTPPLLRGDWQTIPLELHHAVQAQMTELSEDDGVEESEISALKLGKAEKSDETPPVFTPDFAVHSLTERPPEAPSKAGISGTLAPVKARPVKPDIAQTTAGTVQNKPVVPMQDTVENAPMAPMPGAAASSVAPSPQRYTLKADIERPAEPAQKSAKPTAPTPVIVADRPVQREATKAISHPPLAFGAISNIEAVAPMPSELQFSLKVEMQPIAQGHPVRTAHTPTPVANQIAEQLPHLITKAEKQTVELRLDPPELGRVTIHLTTHDQQVTAHITADRTDTVELMRRHAELLTATLARAGFSQADLSFQQGKNQSNQGGFSAFQSTSSGFESDEPAPPAPAETGLNGRLDIRL